MSSKDQKIKVIELFAGVGGFRVGLERADKNKFHVVFSNQWEPSTTKQHASEVYVSRFGNEGHVNDDINKVPSSEIPDHDLLVGGFPCQDYSVAKTLSQSKGINGKKGVLWWSIHRILKDKIDAGHPTKYLMLENVDRLLKSPATLRGRDFAVMLASLSDLGYHAEWRVINAADYGMPQRRRRVFIVGYHESSPIGKKLSKGVNAFDWLSGNGITAKAFPVTPINMPNSLELEGDLSDISNLDMFRPEKSPFMDSGMVIKREVFTMKTKPNYEGPKMTIDDIALDEKDVPPEFFINEKDLPKWRDLKGAKQEKRTTKDGFTYNYSEGSMVFPDRLDAPSRTIVTGEGGSTPSRFKHVIKTKSGKYRRLTPIELEKLCMFPEGHTAGQPDTKRAFFMGNALVVGIIEKLGKALGQSITID